MFLTAEFIFLLNYVEAGEKLQLHSVDPFNNCSQQIKMSKPSHLSAFHYFSADLLYNLILGDFEKMKYLAK